MTCCSSHQACSRKLPASLHIWSFLWRIWSWINNISTWTVLIALLLFIQVPPDISITDIAPGDLSFLYPSIVFSVISTQSLLLVHVTWQLSWLNYLHLYNILNILIWLFLIVKKDVKCLHASVCKCIFKHLSWVHLGCGIFPSSTRKYFLMLIHNLLFCVLI